MKTGPRNPNAGQQRWEATGYRGGLETRLILRADSRAEAIQQATAAMDVVLSVIKY